MTAVVKVVNTLLDVSMFLLCVVAYRNMLTRAFVIYIHIYDTL